MDRWFLVKSFLLVMGAGFGIAGMIGQRDVLVWTGIALIAIGILLRLVTRRDSPTE